MSLRPFRAPFRFEYFQFLYSSKIAIKAVKYCNPTPHTIKNKTTKSFLHLLRRFVSPNPPIPILHIPPLLHILRDLARLIPLRRHRVAPLRPARHHARPDPLPQLLILQIPAILAGPTCPHLGARMSNPDAQNGRALHLGPVRRDARVGPAGREHVVRDQLHSIQLLGLVGDGLGIPERDHGSVVAAVVVRREREDEAVHQRRGHGHGRALRGGVRRAGLLHQARRDVAVQVEIERADGRIGVG